jgi:hypothetical protein
MTSTNTKMMRWMTWSRPRGALLGSSAVMTVVALLATSCATGTQGPSTQDPSARYFSNPQPVANSPAPEASASTGAQASAPTGPVSRPNPRLTPGVVVTTDVNAVCEQPKRVRAAISSAQQQAVFYTYRIPYPPASPLYGLDYLVPLQLGGAAVTANIWPAAVNGVGFHEKEQLNYRMRRLVCQGGMSLTQAQQEIATDWYALWVQYVA